MLGYSMRQKQKMQSAYAETASRDRPPRSTGLTMAFLQTLCSASSQVSLCHPVHLGSVGLARGIGKHGHSYKREKNRAGHSGVDWWKIFESQGMTRMTAGKTSKRERSADGAAVDRQCYSLCFDGIYALKVGVRKRVVYDRYRSHYQHPGCLMCSFRWLPTEWGF